MLLDRKTFKQEVFRRDGCKCVACGEPAVDAHHLIERKLFHDGGYYLNNGVSVCAACHLLAEQTVLSVEELRKFAKITEKVLPPSFYEDQVVDKWGNPVMPNGLRMRGELFEEEGVQKILEEGNVLGLFTKYVKYPRTMHLPWSPGKTNDDRVLTSIDSFVGQEIVITVKMDGENTTLYSDYIHARSTSDKKHWSKSWIKNLHAKIAHEIPANWRMIVENMYATHSIRYQYLASLCYGISIWDENNRCLCWDETVKIFEMLGIPTVPVLFRGKWNEDIVRGIYKTHFNGDDCEGLVVRVAGDFHFSEFSSSVAKFVRKGHVADDKDHWFSSNTGERNKLATEL